MASGLGSDIGRDVRRLLEISRNGEEAKRWDWIDGRGGEKGDAKGQVQPGPVVVSHGGACTATERREDTIYIFIPRGRSHRIDGRRRDALSSAAGGKNRGRSRRPFRDREFLIGFPTGRNVIPD